MLTRTISALLLFSAAAVGQTTCPGGAANLVPNGGFEDLLFNAWSVSSSAAITYPTASVNGITTSRCLDVGAASYSAVQPKPFRLSGGATYAFRADVEHKYPGPDFSTIYVAPAGTTSWTAVAQAYSRAGKIRMANLYTPTVDGDYIIRIDGSNARLDNVSVLPASAPIVRVVYSSTYDTGRYAGAVNTLHVQGTPSANFALHFGGGGILPQGIAFSFCGGSWLLAPPMLLATAGALNTSGHFDIDLPMPASLAGIRLDWQAVRLAPNCELGCAEAYAFY
jgi:hypothetical protein